MDFLIGKEFKKVKPKSENVLTFIFFGSIMSLLMNAEMISEMVFYDDGKSI